MGDRLGAESETRGAVGFAGAFSVRSLHAPCTQTNPQESKTGVGRLSPTTSPTCHIKYPFAGALSAVPQGISDNAEAASLSATILSVICCANQSLGSRGSGRSTHRTRKTNPQESKTGAGRLMGPTTSKSNIPV